MQRSLLFIASVCCHLSSCQKPDIKDDSGPCTTLRHSDVTEISVKLFGQMDMAANPADAVEPGFIYSLDKNPDPANGTTVQKDKFLSSGQFQATITGLSSHTTYY